MQDKIPRRNGEVLSVPNWLTHPPGLRELGLLLESTCGETLRQPCPEFHLNGLPLGSVGQSRIVCEDVMTDAPFGRLLRFSNGSDAPPVLLVAPMSGHSSAQLRDTVLGLLPHYQVYVTDWRDARDVPLSEGAFGLDDYIDYLLRYMKDIGGAHMIAICQSCVPALAATALLAEDRHPAQPRSLTLIAGPINARENPSPVNHFATGAPLRWFEEQLISRVAPTLRGAGRRVYGGAMQILTSVGMEQQRRMTMLVSCLADPLGYWQVMLKMGNALPVQQPVMDLPAEFYLDNLRDVFQGFTLARGAMQHRGRTVRPEQIRNSALLTVEAADDEICGAGQTRAAHALCSSLPDSAKRHFEVPGASHRDVFSGVLWTAQVLPEVRRLMESVDKSCA